MSQNFHGQIRDLTAKGLGVVDNLDGHVFFVPGAWPGDQAEFQVPVEQRGRYGTAHLISLAHPSPERVTPPCPHHGIAPGFCGGCPWMMAAYSAQLRFKQNGDGHPWNFMDIDETLTANVGTFVRDACALRKRQWQLKEVQPLDLFPHTPHVEIMSCFKRSDRKAPSSS